MNAEVFDLVRRLGTIFVPQIQLELIRAKIISKMETLKLMSDPERKQRILSDIQEYMNLFYHIYRGKSADTYSIYYESYLTLR